MPSKRPLLEERRTLTNETNGSLFYEHPVRCDLSDQELAYLNKLFGNTVPTPQSHLYSGCCYQWCGSLDKDGYPRHNPPKFMPGSGLVHRFVYQYAIGPTPEEDMWNFSGAAHDITVHHQCGNRACINLLHLQILPLKLNRELGDPRNLFL
mgnify:CR=1 FL=1